MDEFTKEEMHRIDVLYGTDFKDIKPEDAMLIARWEKYRALQDEEAKARFAVIEKEGETRAKEARKTAKLAQQQLTEQANAAMQRFERLLENE